MTTKGLVSILIPARNELFLTKTIQDLLDKATGDIEIIVVLDRYWPTETIREHWTTPAILQDERISYVHLNQSRGMRDNINAAAAIAKGEYLMKSDAHCMYAKGFDEALKADMEDNWIVIPRRKRLDAELWQIQDVGKPDIDYEYLSTPNDKGVKGCIWTERAIERADKPEYLIDENMSFQGSCWFMTYNHFHNRIGGMNAEGYGNFVREAQELGLKTWLGGGKVMVNKKTWYAHLHKGTKYGRMYFIDKREMQRGCNFCDDYWYNNRWQERKYDLAWLIERFMPVPGWTPELIDKVRAK